MAAEFLQFLFSGITVGAAYALAALGFTIIYNTSGVINFAQGEFIMLGGMLSAAMLSLGLPLYLAIALAIIATGIVGLIVEKLVIEPAKDVDVIGLIIITIGASLAIRGCVQVWLGKSNRTLPSFSGDTPLKILDASLLPQSLWVLGVAFIIVMLLGWFFGKTVMGKSMLATSYNKLAAQLMGINTKFILFISFGLSSILGAVGGAILTPITFTSYDVGIMLGLKGFVAAVLGGMGSGAAVVAGGLLLGIAESMAAGYISSSYKDAVPFLLILLILFFRPNGLFSAKSSERV